MNVRTEWRKCNKDNPGANGWPREAPRQIDATDKEIDRLVYDLYGLTEKEIKIVEEATH